MLPCYPASVNYQGTVHYLLIEAFIHFCIIIPDVLVWVILCSHVHTYHIGILLFLGPPTWPQQVGTTICTRRENNLSGLLGITLIDRGMTCLAIFCSLCQLGSLLIVSATTVNQRSDVSVRKLVCKVYEARIFLEGNRIRIITGPHAVTPPMLSKLPIVWY